MARMKPAIEQELAHILLIELLAHQFAFPVQWINTQDVILQNKDIERVIEIGPGSTLANMFKRTLTSYDDHDTANVVRRHILTTHAHADEIYYRTHSAEDVEPNGTVKEIQMDKPQDPVETAKLQTTKTTVAPQNVTPPPALSEITLSPLPITDIPIPALSIITTLVALKLRITDLASLSTESSIKKLSAGRSTLQNEIIGELSKEFGSLPDGSEETNLEDLAATLTPTFNGQLGAVTRSQITRMVASKFPAELGMSTTREYLGNRWGFGVFRQDGALLVAMLLQPDKRLASVQEGHDFLDTVAQKYAAKENIVLATDPNHHGTVTVPQVAVASPEQFEALKRAQSSWSKHNLQFHAADLGLDLNADRIEGLKSRKLIANLQSELDDLRDEHGEDFLAGTRRLFAQAKMRAYNSSWNWSQQAFLNFAYRMTRDQIAAEDIHEHIRGLANRSDQALLKLMRDFKGRGLREEKVALDWRYPVVELLIDTCERAISHGPCASLPELKAPSTTVASDGKISYLEVARYPFPPTDSSAIDLLMGAAMEAPAVIRIEEVDDDVAVTTYAPPQFKSIIHGLMAPTPPPQANENHDGYIASRPIAQITKNTTGLMTPPSPPLSEKKETDISASISQSSTQSNMNEYNVSSASSVSSEESVPQRGMSHDADAYNFVDNLETLLPLSGSKLNKVSIVNLSHSVCSEEMLNTLRASYREKPLISIQSKCKRDWQYNQAATECYVSSLKTWISTGYSTPLTVLLTGAGKNSIALKLLETLLAVGAKVVVTTSSYSPSSLEIYRDIYTKYGSRNSELRVVPFNQGSKRDVEDLIEYVYGTLGFDLDCVVPFAAISETGREMDSIDARSELAYRIMLTNVMRMLGAVKRQKQKRDIICKPTQVILPLSPNHGTFGGDGLYAESKLALESLFAKWHSESWSDFLSICGAVIGWTRGTGLMSQNDVVADGIEALGVRTFSQDEMAFCILGLISPSFRDMCSAEPLLADLSGGMDEIPDLMDAIQSVREKITSVSDVRRAVVQDLRQDQVVVRGSPALPNVKSITSTLEPRPTVAIQNPRLPNYSTELHTLSKRLEGMVDLAQTIVVVGFAEVGPYGSARTRWEIEADGQFSLAGYIEMAWIMGLIKHYSGKLDGEDYSGWVATSNNERLSAQGIKRKFEQHITDNTGIRNWEINEQTADDDQVFHEVVIKQDLAPFETSEDVASEFKRTHGDKVDIFPTETAGMFEVQLRAGASLRIPRGSAKGLRVAGQLPTGWNPQLYGITDDIISQVDPVSLYVLVCALEALYSAGITDPYELYKYIHVSDIANCIGSGMGGLQASKRLFHQRHMDKEVQSDILQEAFINTPSAWVNMLLMSASGPIKTPVGACATSLESLESGCETILSGKSKLCFVGGVDDLNLDTADEFANMKATVVPSEHLAQGRTPKEMSRPTTSTRNGFVESQGCGVQIITTAKLALEMGLPIRAIVALSELASDKVGRSVPAPGVGLLTTVRQSPSILPPASLDINYRRRNLDLRKQYIAERKETDLLYLEDEVKALKESGATSQYISEYTTHFTQNIEIESAREWQEALHTWGNQFWKTDSRISPIKGSLAVWDLTIDDIGVASFHGTSTKKNDENECKVLHQQFTQLGRTPGNMALGVFQKYLTGHSKGAAGAWMLNGAIQILDTGFVPGNRNADNIDPSLRKYDMITFPRDGIQTNGVNAISVTSFGFGQKGAQSILVHPKFVLATLTRDVYDKYCADTLRRQRLTQKYFSRGMITNTLFVAKDHAPYEARDEFRVLTDWSARLEDRGGTDGGLRYYFS